jgi:predicted AlkP superfamily phosphohydrolase/phosphomutase
MPGPHGLLIIGIDGADYHTLTDWLARGRLPHLAALVSHGQLLRCESTRPPLTAPAWTTALTGCNPGKHGTYDFLDFSFPTRRPWWSLPRGRPDLFERLSAVSVSCGALNIPMVYPARESHGVMVSGFGCPCLADDGFHPRSLRRELLAAVPEYAVYPASGCYLGGDPDQLFGFTRTLGRAAAYLLDHYDLDVFMLVFGSLDWAGHAHVGEAEPFDGVPLSVAEAIDDEIGRLVARTDWPKTPVLLVSDHGMRCAERQINLPKLFVDLGLMQVRWADEVPARRRLATSALISAWRLAKRVLPRGLIRRLRIAGDSVRRELAEDRRTMEIDWERTIAFPLGAYGSIRLGLQGREPGGGVALTDYERVRRQVIEKLRSVIDPESGEPVFGEVLSREQVFSGPLIAGAPDIVVSPRGRDMALGIPALESQLMLFTRQSALVEPMVPRWGVHTQDAVLGISGDVVRGEAPAPDCGLADFAPTVLHLLGLPVPSYMDGRALTECLTEAPARGPGVMTEETLTMAEAPLFRTTLDDEEVLTARLRSLGYL